MSTLYRPVEVIYAQMMRRVTKHDGGCWNFTGCLISTGYGCVSAGKSGKTVLAHRLAVMMRDGEIPEGMTVDHACHDSAKCTEKPCPHRTCVNPDHLVVMSGAENTARKWESGMCRKGHPLATKADGRRYCRECAAEKNRKRSGNTSSAYWANRRGEKPAA